ncbi:DsbC family protein, partial [Glaciimonas sp. Gout2]
MRINRLITVSAIFLFSVMPYAMGSNVAVGLQHDDTKQLGNFGALKKSDSKRAIGLQASAQYGLLEKSRNRLSVQSIPSVGDQAINNNLWNSLPMEKSFKRVEGLGERHVTVFSDPNCSYCKRLEAELAKLHNVTVHTFIFPFLSENSREKGNNILCAKNPSAVWGEWMLHGKAPVKNPLCASTLQELLDVGRRFDIRGTPVLIFPDGSRISGFISAETIEKKLE